MSDLTSVKQSFVARHWSFVERYCPGARAAWERDVGQPDTGFSFGVTGGAKTYPLRAVATSKDWTKLPPDARQRFEYLAADKTWRRMHP